MLTRFSLIALMVCGAEVLCCASDVAQEPAKFYHELLSGFISGLPPEGKAVEYASELSMGDVGGLMPASAGLENGKISRLYRIGRNSNDGIFIVGKNIVKGEERFAFAVAISHDLLEFVDGTGEMFFSRFKTPKGTAALRDKINTRLKNLDVPIFFALTGAVSDWEKAIEYNMSSVSPGVSAEDEGKKLDEYLIKPLSSAMHDTVFSVSYTDAKVAARKLWLSFDFSPTVSPKNRIKVEYKDNQGKLLFEDFTLTTDSLKPLSISAFETTPSVGGVSQKSAFVKILDSKHFGSLREVIDTKTIFDSDAGVYLDE